MIRTLLAVMVLAGGSALAQEGMGIDGVGRISVVGGFRWVPNWHFKEKAAEAGYPMVPTLEGGASGAVSFGLGVSRFLEVAVEVPLGYHGFQLEGPDGTREDFTSFSAGAYLGPRLVASDVLFKGLLAWAGAGGGGLLTTVGGRRQEIPERLVLSFTVAGGLTWRITQTYGISLEVRYVNGRNAVAGISGINAGGVWFNAGLTIFFPPAIKRDLDVPGF